MKTIAPCVALLTIVAVSCDKNRSPQTASVQPQPQAPSVESVEAVEVTPVVAKQADRGQLKIRFEYAADAPQRKPIDPNKDKDFCGKTKLYEEGLIVNKENKGIKNVIVYIYTRGASGFDVPPGDKTHTLANDKCRFDPHVVIAQTGDKLNVTNPDDVSHNANLQFLVNDAQNFTIPPKQEKSVDLVEKEPAPIPVVCNIHPWMKAFVVVLDHPYAGLSDDNGELVIDGLPPGTHTFRVNHETGSFKGVKVGSEEISRRNTFEVEIKPGLNDLGTVVMPETE